MQPPAPWSVRSSSTSTAISTRVRALRSFHRPSRCSSRLRTRRHATRCEHTTRYSSRARSRSASSIRAVATLPASTPSCDAPPAVRGSCFYRPGRVHNYAVGVVQAAARVATRTTASTSGTPKSSAISARVSPATKRSTRSSRPRRWLSCRRNTGDLQGALRPHASHARGRRFETRRAHRSFLRSEADALPASTRSACRHVAKSSRPRLTTVEGTVTRFSPPPIYTAQGGLLQAPVVPHNRPPQARTYGNGSREMRVLLSTYPTGVWL